MAKKILDPETAAVFAAAWLRGEAQAEAEEMKTALSGLGKKAHALALEVPELLAFMADQVLIPLDEVDKYLLELDWTAKPSVTERLLQYKKNPPRTVPKPKEKKVSAPSAKDDWGTEKLPDGTWKLKSYKGKDTLVQIPESLGKARVSVLGRSLFYPCAQGVDDTRRAVRQSIKEVMIPDGISAIEEGEFGKGGTFCGCIGLKSVKIPDSLTSIGSKAFQGCTKLTDIVLSENTTYIGSEAFEGCRSLAAIRIPESVERIERNTFQSCEKLSTVIFSNSLLELKIQAFDGCSQLREVCLPNSLKTLGSWAFSGCKRLEIIVIPESVTEIGKDVFRGCSKLTIHAPAGSYAEQYAKENNIPFAAE